MLSLVDLYRNLMGNAVPANTCCCAPDINASPVNWPVHRIAQLKRMTPEGESPREIIEREAHDANKTYASSLGPMLVDASELVEDNDFIVSFEGTRGHVFNVLNVMEGAFVVCKGYSAPSCGPAELQEKYIICASSQSEKSADLGEIRWRHCILRSKDARFLLKISNRREITALEERVNLIITTHHAINHFLLPHIDVYHDNDCTYEVFPCPLDADDKELPTFLKPGEVLPEKEVAKIIYHLLVAVQQLSSLDIIYRNLQVDDICRYGSHYYLTNFAFSAEGCEATPIGSPAMWSIDVFERQRYTVKSTIYSIGITTWLLLMGNHPFYRRDMDFEDIEQAVRKKEWISCNNNALFMDNVLRSFISTCCVPEDEMSSIKTFLDHECMQMRNPA